MSDRFERQSRKSVTVSLNDFPTTLVGFIPFSNTNLDEAVTWFLDQTKLGRRDLAVRLINAYCVTVAEDDDKYRQLTARKGINFPDGMSVALVMNLLGRPTAGRVRGPSFFTRAIERSTTRNLSHYFVGSTARTLQLLVGQLEVKVPGIQVAGAYSPPFRPVDDEFISDIAVRIPSDCDIVWVGLGSPKQDYVAQALAERTGKSCVGVGAAFDFVAGTVPEAPVWIQRSGFEWLFRFVSEPRRLWRRYLIGNVQFTFIVLRQFWRRAAMKPQRSR